MKLKYLLSAYLSVLYTITIYVLCFVSLDLIYGRSNILHDIPIIISFDYYIFLFIYAIILNSYYLNIYF